jgi:hypothetical protein
MIPAEAYQAPINSTGWFSAGSAARMSTGEQNTAGEMPNRAQCCVHTANDVAHRWCDTVGQSAPVHQLYRSGLRSLARPGQAMFPKHAGMTRLHARWCEGRSRFIRRLAPFEKFVCLPLRGSSVLMTACSCEPGGGAHLGGAVVVGIR